MGTFIDITGQRIGRLTVLCRTPDCSSRHLRWRCQCDCGRTCDVLSLTLRRERTASCGCWRRLGTHRRSRTVEYRTWRGIITRCENPRVAGFPDYGGRGIKVCDRWRRSFPTFLADMGPRPSPDHSVERNDTNGDYEPANCRWATQVEQANNTRRTRYITYRGQRMSLCNAVRAAGSVIHREAAWIRIKTGWTVERALETPRLHLSGNAKDRRHGAPR